MSTRKIEFTDDCYYHIYNRGVDKRLIFMNDRDRLRFLHVLYFCNDKKPIDMRLLSKEIPSSSDKRAPLVDIGAYCFMPNHFHVLVKTKRGEDLTVFMRKLGTGYAMYFNKIYKRTGRLFEGAFKAKLIENDEYLRHMSLYIHTNALELKDPQWKEWGVNDVQAAHAFLESYQWSSYPRYLGKNEDAILNLNVFPEYFENGQAYKAFLGNWILNHEYQNDYEGASFA